MLYSLLILGKQRCEANINPLDDYPSHSLQTLTLPLDSHPHLCAEFLAVHFLIL
jgi:hypothetical protein